MDKAIKLGAGRINVGIALLCVCLLGSGVTL